MATATASKGGTDLWNTSLKLVTDHIAEFVITFVLFIIISLVIGAIFSVVAMAVAAPAGYYGVYRTASLGISPVYGIITAIGGVFGAFVVLWFIATLYNIIDMIGAGKVDYVNAAQSGFNRVLASGNILLYVLALGFVAGLLEGLWSFGFFGAAGVLLGSILGGICIAAYVGIALTGMRKNPDVNFLNVFSSINTTSSTAGIFLYVAVGIAIIPIISILQFILVPVAVAILAIAGGAGAAAKKAQAAPPTGKKPKA
jgi:hypothetical protein